MPTSLIEGNSLLALDIGTVSTRAAFFDVVDGRYRFVAMGQAPTTIQLPASDMAIGIRESIQDLESIIGRQLMDEDQRLAIPTTPEGVGVDQFVTTMSAGPIIKTAIFGLLSEVSLESVHHLNGSTYARVVESIGMNDKRKPDEQIDTLLKTSPELILIAGGTDGGASRSIQKMLEVIGLYSHILPAEKRPYVLYAGNSELGEEVKNSLEKLVAGVSISSNIRPSLETEDLEAAQNELGILVGRIRKKQIPGAEELSAAAGGSLLPTAHAEGRMIRFLSAAAEKGILSVNLGASAATVLAASGGRLSMNVLPQFGLGEALGAFLKHATLDEIVQWLPLDLPLDFIREYLYLKSTYPATVPATIEDMAVEQAIARQNLHLAIKSVFTSLPRAKASRPGFMPGYDPIFVGGSVFTAAPTLGQSLLMLLDAVQPVGVTTVMLNDNSMLAMLGAAAEYNSILPIHVVESGALASLATVVAPISSANYGAPILRLRVTSDDGEETRLEIKQGGIEIIPLALGRTAQVRLEPIGRTDVGAGPGKSRVEKVKGSALGIAIDARGRPLRLPGDAVRRRELLKKWLWTVGG